MGARMYVVIAQEFCGSKLRAISNHYCSTRFSTQWLRNVNDRKREMWRKLGCKIFSLSRMFDRLLVLISSNSKEPGEINLSKWKCVTLLCFHLRVLELKVILWLIIPQLIIENQANGKRRERISFKASCHESVFLSSIIGFSDIEDIISPHESAFQGKVSWPILARWW